jgi:hypothetical protein
MILLINFGILAIIVFSLITVFLVIKQKVAGGNDWRQKFWAAVSLFVCGASLVFITLFVWPFFSHIVEMTAEGILTISPLGTALFLGVICWAGIWSSFSLINYCLARAWGDTPAVKIIRTTSLIAGIFLSLFVLFHFSGIVSQYKGEWIWAVRFTVALAFILAGVPLIKWWTGKGQNYLATFISYGICCVCTGYIASALGWSVTANILGSIYSLSFALVFNAIIFWLLVGLTATPQKSFRSSIGFFFVFLWMLGLVGVSGYILHLQTMGRVSWHELEVSRTVTQANQRYENFLRGRAAQDVPELKKSLKLRLRTGMKRRLCDISRL